MKKILLIALFLCIPQVTLADGSQVYTSPGTYTFTVPSSYNSLTVQVWGAGGGGAGGYSSDLYGQSGGTSAFGGVTAYGGAGGGGAVNATPGTFGAGGSAGGGDVNTPGGNGTSNGSNPDMYGNPVYYAGSGGGSPNGGSGGSGAQGQPPGGSVDNACTGCSGFPGNTPGGGGGNNYAGDTIAWGYGGGGGGYAQKTYYYGQLPATVTVTVGSGGAWGGYYDSHGGLGAPGEVAISWSGTPPVPSCSITITPNPLTYGSSATLKWSSNNATSFYINSIGYVGASGSTIVSPGATTNYNGSVSNAGGNGTCPATLTVNPPATPMATIAASSSSIYAGQSTNLTATFVAGSGDSLTGDNIDSPIGTGLGADTNPGPKSIVFSTTTPGTYTFYARATTSYYPSWTTYAQTSITVNAAPQCAISLTPTSITQGQSATLAYSSSNVTGFSINNVGSIAPNTTGSIVVSPTQSTDYTGTASVSGYSAQCAAAGTIPLGTLTVSCTPAYSCSGQTIQYTDSSCHVTTVTTCQAPQFCQSGSSQCQYPTVSVTQHLKVVPNLVSSGQSAQIYWNIDPNSAQSCTVTAPNGDSWTGFSSQTGGNTSKAISAQTTYTLYCKPWGTSPALNESQTVNLAPTYHER
ncbi:MAG: hypothetical protein P4L81_01855 [Candidatus Pacebacteria bacterium]|nr:hypothetical protein [Candidatus Paceibacterota bacterium]